MARELTKRHEQQVGPNVGAALAHFRQRLLGECTVVLGGAPVAVDPEPDDSELQRRLQVKIQEGSAPARQRVSSPWKQECQNVACTTCCIRKLTGRLSPLMERLLLRLRPVAERRSRSAAACDAVSGCAERTRSAGDPTGGDPFRAASKWISRGNVTRCGSDQRRLCLCGSDAGSAERLNGVGCGIQGDELAFHHQPGDATRQQIGACALENSSIRNLDHPLTAPALALGRPRA